MKGEICAFYAGGLVESARGNGRPTGEFYRHLDGCSECRERWEAEKLVTAGLSIIRQRTADRTASPESRERVLRAFEEARPTLMANGGPKRRVVFMNPRSMAWSLAAAAVLLITASVVLPLRSHFRAAPRTMQATAAKNSEATSADVISTDARGLTNDEFVAVPYAPPLASGEMVRIVHADLDPQALATLGLTPAPGSTEDLPAELVVGEDGYPRAVRISDNPQF